MAVQVSLFAGFCLLFVVTTLALPNPNDEDNYDAHQDDKNSELSAKHLLPSPWQSEEKHNIEGENKKEEKHDKDHKKKSFFEKLGDKLKPFVKGAVNNIAKLTGKVDATVEDWKKKLENKTTKKGENPESNADDHHNHQSYDNYKNGDKPKQPTKEQQTPEHQTHDKNEKTPYTSDTDEWNQNYHNQEGNLPNENTKENEWGNSETNKPYQDKKKNEALKFFDKVISGALKELKSLEEQVENWKKQIKKALKDLENNDNKISKAKCGELLKKVFWHQRNQQNYYETQGY